MLILDWIGFDDVGDRLNIHGEEQWAEYTARRDAAETADRHRSRVVDTDVL